MPPKSHILVLHGALGSSDQFKELTALLENEFTVHNLNFSGHGGSLVPAGGFTLELFENNILDFLDIQVIESTHIFGYSMGGYVALSFAGKYPKRVKSIFTLATKFDWKTESAMREAAFLDPEKTLSKVPEFAKLLAARHAPVDWKQVMRHTAELLIQLGNQHLEASDFQCIECPVRLSLGDRDKMVSMSETQQIFQLLQKGSMLVIPDTPHPIESCDVQRLSDEIIKFKGEM